MKKYLASGYLYSNEIEEINIERETDVSYWVDGRVNRKETNYDQLFDSFNDAKAFLIAKNAARVSQLVDQLTNAQKKLEDVENKQTYKSKGG